MFVTVSIPNWERYNPRADRGGFSWFRMDNQFYLHMRQRKGYSADATVLLGFLIAECSTYNGKSFGLRVEFAAEMLGKKEKEIISALEQLKKGGEVEISGEEIFKRLEAAPTLTDGRTDGRDETDGRNETFPAQASPARTINSDIWDAYSQEYREKYKKPPVRNAKVNSQISQLAKRLGGDAPDVVRFFVQHNKAFYVEKCHDFGLCLSDAEALHTQWVRGRAVTKTEANRVDRTQSNMNAWDLAAKKIGMANG